MLTTQAFIRQGDIADAIALARQLLYHSHDLMQKAVGWMLREVGDREPGVLETFLLEYRDSMPRTTLRYAVEHLPPGERRRHMYPEESRS